MQENKQREDILAIIEKWVAGVSIGIATILVFVATILRYLFGYSISAFDELTRYLIIWSTFLGASYLLSKNNHITIDILINRVPPRVKLILQTFAYIMGAVFCLLLLLKGATLVLQSMELGTKSQSNLRMPMWIPQSAVPFGALLMFFRFLQKIFSHVKRLLQNDSQLTQPEKV